MKKIKFVLLFLLMIGSLSAQDLSKLTPEQLAAYKKYKNGNASVTNTTPENVTERTVVNN